MRNFPRNLIINQSSSSSRLSLNKNLSIIQPSLTRISQKNLFRSSTTINRYNQTEYNFSRRCFSYNHKIKAQSQKQELNDEKNENFDNFGEGLIDYDIVIVGGGVVGLALANALASSRAISEYGYKILILDSTDLDKSKNWNLPSNTWSNRISSITNENLNFLEKIGVSKHIDYSRTNPVERMQVWDGISNARIVFDSLDDSSNLNYSSKNVPQMARFVENFNLQRAMLKNLDNSKDDSPSSSGSAEPIVKVYGSTKVNKIYPDERSNWPIVNLESGQRIRARLLVGADGFNSPVKSYSKITSTGWNYDSSCLVGTLDLEPTSFNHTAWQRFLLSGPLGFLPLSDCCASLAWSTKPKIANGLKALDGPTLAKIINACYKLPHESVNYLLSRIESHSSAEPINSKEIESEIEWRSSASVNGTINNNQEPVFSDDDDVPPKVLDVRMETVASFPLKMFHADQYVGTVNKGLDLNQIGSNENHNGASARTVLVGDAAHVLHPMAGQGLNMGLGDARELARTIETALENGQDIGSLTVLRNYSRSRYLSNHLIMTTVDKLNKLYSLDQSPIVWLRSVGVEVLNEIPNLKLLMMGQAGGRTRTTRSTRDGEFSGTSYYDGDGSFNGRDGNGVWRNLADGIEGVRKVKYLVEGIGKFALGNLKSIINNKINS